MFWCYDCIQEGHGTIWHCVFYCQLDFLVYDVDVLQKSLCSVHCMIKVSPAYLFHSLSRFFAVLRAISSKCCINKSVTLELTGNSMVAPSTCLYNCAWNKKFVLRRQNLKKLYDVLYC